MILHDYFTTKGKLRKVMADHHVSKDGFIAECIRVYRKKPHTVQYETWRMMTIKTEINNKKSYSKAFCKSESGHPDAKTVTVGYF